MITSLVGSSSLYLTHLKFFFFPYSLLPFKSRLFSVRREYKDLVRMPGFLKSQD